MPTVEDNNIGNSDIAKQKVGLVAVIIIIISLLVIGRLSFYIMGQVINHVKIKDSDEVTTIAKGSKFEIEEPEILEDAAVSYTAPKLKNEDQLNDFLNKYSGVWYMKKEFNEEEEWQYHDLGKKIGIFVFNRLNDYSTRSIVGTTTHTQTLYLNGVPIDSTSYDTPIWGVAEHHDGLDIKYDEDLIVLDPLYVDFTDLDGPMFSTEDFRYENIGGYDFIISDLYGFGFCFDGTYLEYVEPDSIGNYQGYFAFDSTSYSSLINQDYNDGLDW